MQSIKALSVPHSVPAVNPQGCWEGTQVGRPCPEVVLCHIMSAVRGFWEVTQLAGYWSAHRR